MPGSSLDRTAFTTVIRGFSNPPWFISGHGSHASPWRLKVFSSVSKADPSQAPLIVSLGDDPDGFFQSSPPAPIDLAVVLTNIKRLERKHVASGVVLAWEAPDPIGLAALEKAMGGFESMVVTAPLSRGAVSSAMPPAFRRASIPIDQVLGDTTLLPRVNRIPLPGVVLGGENVSAGFSILESETPQSLSPLIAKWEDRIVFSFPLLAVLQRLNCPVSQIEISVGKFLKLGTTGRIIPIDAYGRLTLPMKKSDASTEISAEAVVDGDGNLFPKTTPDPIILRDDRTAAEPAARNFSATLSATISALASDHGLASESTYPRLAWIWEALVLFTVILILGFVPYRLLSLSGLLVSGICLALPWILLGTASVWLPLPVMLATGFTVIMARVLICPKTAPPPSVLVEKPILADIPAPEIVLPPQPVIKETKTKSPAAKKTPAKKVAAKKAAKKVAAKKTATPRAPRTKKPPTES